MRNYIIVALGAGLGGVGRFWLAHLIQRILPPNFPYGTLAVNILGSFILGLVMYMTEAEVLIGPEIRIFLTIGVCGALTTFSTFSYETLSMLREAEFFYAGINITANVLLTLAGIGLAFILAKSLLGV
ncbi:MAG TPA: fluoride efflux transporter CrcB [bacterium]|nr:fluoride efflux transporter CrcB [bacterium]